MADQNTQLRTEIVTYDVDGVAMQGYLACPAYPANKQQPRPGILVIHEWWGLDSYIKQRAEMLAALGYCALAVDMYGGGQTAQNPEQAGALMNSILGDMATGTARLKATHQYLQNLPQVDSHKTAAIGYCFGGAMVLHAARIGMDLSAVASFHGALGSFHKPEPGQVTAKVLVCHGADDSLVPAEDIANFKAEMEQAEANYEFIAYPGALHGFSNPQATANGERFGLPLAYDSKTDEQSWQAMQRIFNDVFA